MFSGYYDDYGRRINEGDHVNAICEGELITGVVLEEERCRQAWKQYKEITRERNE